MTHRLNFTRLEIQGTRFSQSRCSPSVTKAWVPKLSLHGVCVFMVCVSSWCVSSWCVCLHGVCFFMVCVFPGVPEERVQGPTFHEKKEKKRKSAVVDHDTASH